MSCATYSTTAREHSAAAILRPRGHHLHYLGTFDPVIQRAQIDDLLATKARHASFKL